MLDTTKTYAVSYTVPFGKERRIVFAKLYFSDFYQSFRVTSYFRSLTKSGHVVVSPSTVWAGTREQLIENVEVLHEWTRADDVRFKAAHDDLVAYMQGGIFQESLF